MAVARLVEPLRGVDVPPALLKRPGTTMDHPQPSRERTSHPFHESTPQRASAAQSSGTPAQSAPASVWPKVCLQYVQLVQKWRVRRGRGLVRRADLGKPTRDRPVHQRVEYLRPGVSLRSSKRPGCIPPKGLSSTAPRPCSLTTPRRAEAPAACERWPVRSEHPRDGCARAASPERWERAVPADGSQLPEGGVGVPPPGSRARSAAGRSCCANRPTH
jgi:hypothetical protein